VDNHERAGADRICANVYFIISENVKTREFTADHLAVLNFDANILDNSIAYEIIWRINPCRARFILQPRQQCQSIQHEAHAALSRPASSRRSAIS
jgi:hypothetical protein